MVSEKKIDYMQTKGPPASVQVNLRLGYPDPSSLPMDVMRKAFQAKLSETDPDFFMYGVVEGYLQFRERLAEFLTERFERTVDAADIMAVNGSSGGLDLVLKTYTSEGDIIFAENPTYFLAQHQFNDHKLKTVYIDMDQDGINIEALEAQLQVHKPKLLYIIPIGHNPTGRTTSLEKRRRLVELADKYNFIIVSDEVYQLLTFEKCPPPMNFFESYIPRPRVLSLNSFSKIVAPALRLGWIQAHPSLLQPIKNCGLLDSGGCLNPIMCGMIEKAIEMNLLHSCVNNAAETLKNKYAALKSALRKHMPEEVTFEEPKGGYFLICKLPSGMLSTDLLEEAKTHKVIFLPGTTFGEGYENYIRLSFSYYSPEDIETGVERLAAAYKSLKDRNDRS